MPAGVPCGILELVLDSQLPRWLQGECHPGEVEGALEGPVSSGS